MLGLHFSPACVLRSVCSLHITLSLHFTPGPQSAVCVLHWPFPEMDSSRRMPGHIREFNRLEPHSSHDLVFKIWRNNKTEVTFGVFCLWLWVTRNQISMGTTGILGTLRSNDADGIENVQKTIGFYKKNQPLCTCITLFCTFLCPFLHDYDVKMPNLAFYGVCKQATAKFYFSFWTWITLGSRGYFFLSILMVRGETALTRRKAPRRKK